MARVHSATIKEDTEDDESSDSNYEEHSESSDSEEVEEEVHPARVTRCNKGYQCKMNRKCVGNCVYKKTNMDLPFKTMKELGSNLQKKGSRIITTARRGGRIHRCSRELKEDASDEYQEHAKRRRGEDTSSSSEEDNVSKKVAERKPPSSVLMDQINVLKTQLLSASEALEDEKARRLNESKKYEIQIQRYKREIEKSKGEVQKCKEEVERMKRQTTSVNEGIKCGCSNALKYFELL